MKAAMANADSEGCDEAYFMAHHRDSPTLPLRAKPCGDCPVVYGMYLGISNDLARCSDAVIERSTAGWFCHTTPRYACRGNANNVERRKAEQE